MRVRITAALLIGAAVLALAVLRSGAASAAASDPCSGGATPSVSFAGGATSLDVPAGAASAIPPTVQIDCGGAAAPADTAVSVVLAAESDDVDFMSGVPGAAQELDLYPSGSTLTADTDSSGQITLPIVTSLSNSSGGGFSITVSAGSVSAALSGQITGSTSGVLPPSNPANATDAGVYCSDPTGAECISESVAQVNEGRQAEGLGPLELPSNWSSLSVDDQLFVLVNLERTARGLVPVTGLATDWNTAAQDGANAGDDPSSPGSWSSEYSSTELEGDGVSVYPSGDNDYATGADWASYPNDIQAMAGWMYDDGPGGSNGDCQGSDTSGCWGHRDSIIQSASVAAGDGDATSPCAVQCVMGTGYAPTDTDGDGPNYTLVFGPGNNADPVVYSWTSEVSDLPTCEQSGDSCSWAGQPIETSGGTFTTVTSTTPTTTTQPSTISTSGTQSSTNSTSTGSTSTTSTTVTSQTTTKASLGNQAITLTTPAPSACVAPSGKLPVVVDTAAVAGSKKAKLTFRRVALYIDKGVKHTRKVRKKVRVHGRLRTETVTETTYTANATSTRARASLDLSLRGVAKGTHTIRAVITYDETKIVVTRVDAKTKRTRKVTALTKTITSRISVC